MISLVISIIGIDPISAATGCFTLYVPGIGAMMTKI